MMRKTQAIQQGIYTFTYNLPALIPRGNHC